MAIAARIPIMATTIKSSISVKPLSLRRKIQPPATKDQPPRRQSEYQRLQEYLNPHHSMSWMLKQTPAQLQK
jgi:hypothetical protein